MKKLVYIFIFLAIAGIASGQWVQKPDLMGTNEIIYRLISNGTDIYAGTLGTGIYRSTNNGDNWTKVINGIQIQAITSFRGLTISGNSLYAGFMNGYGIYRSTNNGDNWTACGGNWTNVGISCLASSGSRIFAGTYTNGIFLSTDNGTSWNSISNGLPNASINPIIISGTDIYAGTYHRVYRSTNYGSSWFAAFNGLPDQLINCLETNSTNLFAGTDTSGVGGVYRSTNKGENWTQTSLNNTNVYGLAISGNSLFAGTGPNLTLDSWKNAVGGVYVSTNNGVNWLNKNEGFGLDIFVIRLLVVNNYIFAGTGQSVWRRPLSEMIGIQTISTEIPSSYSLSQNYPNPFNPTTKIKFQVKSAGVVKLVVLDILGKEVATLVNEKLQPGTYETTFDASAYPSGAYFYKIETGTYTDVKRMILIK